MRTLVLAAAALTIMVLGAIFQPSAFAWVNEYPCPDMDCSGTEIMAEGAQWANPFACAVNTRQGGYCVDCATNDRGQKICVKSYEDSSCKCEIVSVNGVRTCKLTGACDVWI